MSLDLAAPDSVMRANFSVGLDISALDPQFKDHAHRGIGRYVSELVKFFGKNEAAGFDLAVSTFSQRQVVSAGPRFFRSAQNIVESLPFGRATLRQQFLLPLCFANLRDTSSAKSAALDLIHFPAHMDAPAWGLRDYVITVLDLIPLVCEDLYRRNKSNARFKFARFLELQAIKSASLILAISHNTAKDVHEILGVPYHKIVVTPLGVSREFFAAANQPEMNPGEILSLTAESRFGDVLNRPVILYVGGIDPRKNCPYMLRAFKQLLVALESERGAQKPLLVLAGNISSDREYPGVLKQIESLGIGDDVCMPGYLDDSKLMMLYRNSALFFFPSLYEGFGLPPLEALACGLPVVSSNVSAMPEVLGDAALYCSPHDESSAVNSILSLLKNENLRNELGARGRKQAGQFTWERTGKLTLEAYRKLLIAKASGRKLDRGIHNGANHSSHAGSSSAQSSY